MTGLLWMSLAMAQSPCGPALQAELQTASTLKVPDAYAALAACDPERARRMTAHALEKMFGDDNEAVGVVAMVDVGALEDVVPWLERIPPDDRLSMLRAIGDGCDDSPPRNAFFATMREQKGDRFYIDRWYRGLDACRTTEGRTLLTDALTSERFGVGARDRGAFLDILEVYTRNLRTDALPLLGRYARELSDPEEVAYVLQILPRAAGYDTEEGVDPAQAAQVGEAVFALGDILDPTRIDIARLALERIGQDAVANSLVRYRWPDAWRVGGGRYHYAVQRTETWECRPGKFTVVVHNGEFAEDGLAWPSTLVSAGSERLEQAWGPSAPPCDVTPSIDIAISETPLKTGDHRTDWTAAHQRPFTVRERGRKVTFVEHEPFAW